MNYSIKGAEGLPIDIDISFVENSHQPLVIFLHGFKGFKDWGSFNYIAQSFANRNLNFLKFNFSHNGVDIKNPLDFSDLKSFGENNFSKELFDVDCVLNWCFANLKEKVDLDKIYLMGHSRGGGIGIIKTSFDNRIKKLASWASVSDFESKLPKEKIGVWKERNVIYVFNSRTNQQMPLYYQFYEDFIENAELFNIENAARNIKVPTLIIHGTNDPTVNFEESLSLKSWIKNADFHEVKNADHVFNVVHPFNEDNITLELKKVVDLTISFFKN